MKFMAAIFALLLSPAIQAGDRSEFAELADRGDAAPAMEGKLEDYASAIKAWKETDGKTPRGLVYERLALINMVLSRYEEAEKAINAAIEDNPNSMSAYFTLSRIQSLTGKCADAAATLDKGTLLIPPEQRAPFFYQKGMAKLDCDKDLQAAAKEFRTAYELASNARQAEMQRKSDIQLGQIYCRLQQYGPGMKTLADAGRLVKKAGDYDYLLAVAQCHILKGDSNAAIAAYASYTEKAVELLDKAEKKRPGADIDPGFKMRLPEVYCRRAMIYEQDGARAKALKDFDRAISLELETARLEKNRVRIPTADEAAGFDIGQCYFHRAGLYAARGDGDFAAQDYSEACSRHYQPACAQLKHNAATENK